MARVLLWSSFILPIGCERNPVGTSCNNTHKLLNYEIIDTINIPLDGQQYSHVSTSTLIQGDTIFYYGLDIHNHQIDIFDLSNKQYVKGIFLNNQGVNGIISPFVMDVISADSILLMNDLNTFYLIDNSGNKLKEWSFTGILPDSIIARNYKNFREYSLLAANKFEVVNTPLIYNKKSNTVYTFCLWQPSYSNTIYFFESQKMPPLVELSLEQNKFKRFIGKYPLDYGSSEISLDIFYHSTLSDSDLLIGFMYTPLIYSKADDKYLCVKSYYSKNRIDYVPVGTDLDISEEMRIINTNEAYHGVYYDRYRKVYYRVFQHSQDVYDNDNKLLQRIQAPWSLIVFNKEGVIGEVLFDKEKYDFLNLNVLPNGILISKENTFNINNEENVYSFEIIKIEYE